MTNSENISRHTISALVEDKPGVLNRISSMFRRRGFNIYSLAVGNSEKPNLSRMTFVVEGDTAVVEQAVKNLHKLIDVIRVTDLSTGNNLIRELALIKVKFTAETRDEKIHIANIFRANIVDVDHDSLVLEVVGDDDKVDSITHLLEDFGIVELMRTGSIAIRRSRERSKTTLSNAAESELPAEITGFKSSIF